MHLYRYFSIEGSRARYLNKLCVKTSSINGDNMFYYCKDYLPVNGYRYSTMELRTSHDMTEIVQGVDGEVRFALKFLGLRSLDKNNKFVIEGIARMIYVIKDFIVEKNGFKDIENFKIYDNYCGNVFVDTSSDEESQPQQSEEECEGER